MTDPYVYACTNCGHTYLTPSAANDCCGPWLELD